MDDEENAIPMKKPKRNKELKPIPVDDEIVPILLDTSLYQYEKLTTSSLSLLLRHMRYTLCNS